MLLFLDGQAHYDSSQLALKYSSVTVGAVTWSVVPEGRFGNCIKRVSTSNAGDTGYLSAAPLVTRQGVWPLTSSGVCGFAIKVDDVTKAAPNAVALPYIDALVVVVEGMYWHLALQLNADGTFTLYRGEAAFGGALVILAQSTEGLASAAWAYVECKWLVHDTAGMFEARVNGIPVLTFTGNTRISPVSKPNLGLWNAVHLCGVASSPVAPRLTLRMSDLYLADLTTSDPDDVSDFLGDGTIDTIVPNAPGAAAGWTPNAGANWDMVNDRPAPDGEATHVATTTPGTRDVHHFEDIPPGSEVKAVQLVVLARKETEGSVHLRPIVHQGGTDYPGPTQGVASLAYDRYLTQPVDLNPATGAKFTVAEINAGQFGVEKVL